MEKLLPIINLALSAIAMIVSVVVLLQVMSLPTKIIEAEAEPVEVISEEIPISQLTVFEMSDSEILTIKGLEGDESKYQVLFTLGFSIDSENEDAATATTILTNQGTIVRDKLKTILVGRDITYYNDPEKHMELKAELLTKVHELLQNTAVVDVYLVGMMISEK